MNKKWKTLVIRLLCAAMMAAAISFQSFAASARISFSDPSGNVGEEISVTMKFTSTSGEALGNTDVMLAYDAAKLEYINETENASGGNGAIRVWSVPEGKTEAATVLRFRALTAGTATITVTSWEGYDNNGQALTLDRQGSSTITINGLETSSTDATLQSLQVSPGQLTPAFTPATENYTVTVGLDTDKLTVSANANNENATVAVEGGTDLVEGENTVVCKVTAEDGTTVKNYTIVVNKTEGGENLETSESEEAAPEPEVLAELEVTAKKIRIIEKPDDVEVPNGFKDSSIAIGDARVQGWTWAADEDPRYCVFYGMNENGDQDFYRYDLRDKTVQRYFADENGSGDVSSEYVDAVEKYNSLVDTYEMTRMIMFALIGVSAVLLIVLIVVVVKKRGGGDGNEGGFREPESRSAARSSAGTGRKASKEERYMMGEEDSYEEDDDFEEEELPEDAYLPEEAPSEESAAAKPSGQAVRGGAASKPSGQAVRGGVAGKPSEPVEDVEQAIAATLAKEAAAASEESSEDDEDDFEFVDLDD